MATYGILYCLPVVMDYFIFLPAAEVLLFSYFPGLKQGQVFSKVCAPSTALLGAVLSQGAQT